MSFHDIKSTASCSKKKKLCILDAAVYQAHCPDRPGLALSLQHVAMMLAFGIAIGCFGLVML